MISAFEIAMPVRAAIASSNDNFGSRPSVFQHYWGGFLKPAQRALKTPNGSIYPLKVLLLITMDG
jgi:hypothetical protein